MSRELLHINVRRVLAALAVTAMLVSGGTVAWAQTATLTGIIVDETGAAVNDVAIVLLNVATDLRRQATTATDGSFTFAVLPAGRYALSARRDGFTPLEASVVVNDNDQVALRLELKVAGFGEDVVVTAQKRGEERLLEVPVPVSVLDAERLTSTSQFMIRDYYASLPGLTAMPTIAGGQGLSIRGITTGGLGSATVGFLIDDVPIGSSVSYGGSLLPDIDPGDLARLEVLRGPQGVLYGASSMGGLVKYVSQEPTTDRFSGRVELGTAGVHDGGLGYNVRASVNVPVSRTWAIRASGFRREDAGYVDNPRVSRTDVNDAEASGGRATALWTPSVALSLKLSGLYQRTSTDGSPDVIIEPGLEDLQQNYIAGAGVTHRTLQAYAATLKARVGGTELVYIGGYNRFEYEGYWDYSSSFGSAAQAAFGVPNALYLRRFPTNKVVQEMRASGSALRRVDWQVGGFFTHERAHQTASLFAIDAITGETRGVVGTNFGINGYGERAAFGNVTYRFTDRFDLQAGLRESWVRFFSHESVGTGQFATVAVVAGEIKDAVSTYLVTPRFRVSPDLMVYGRFASGYRPPKANRPIVMLEGAPPASDPDQTKNYEVGLKTELLEQRLSLDASVYYIDWEDLQLSLLAPVSRFSYETNGAGAKSAGVELSAAVRPLHGLTLAGWIAYSDATLTEDLPPRSTVIGFKGERLPESSRWSSNVNVDQAFGVSPQLDIVVGASASVVDDRLGLFTASGNRLSLPGFTKIDLRASADFRAWRLNVFVTNLTDERGQIGIAEVSPLTNAQTYIRPRAFGISFVKEF